jgi:hypothetical protein
MRALLLSALLILGVGYAHAGKGSLGDGTRYRPMAAGKHSPGRYALPRNRVWVEVWERREARPLPGYERMICRDDPADDRLLICEPRKTK